MTNGTSTGFTVIGLLIVIVLMFYFIRSKVVIGILAIILLGLLLINYKRIVPMLFTNVKG